MLLPDQLRQMQSASESYTASSMLPIPVVIEALGEFAATGIEQPGRVFCANARSVLEFSHCTNFAAP